MIPGIVAGVAVQGAPTDPYFANVVLLAHMDGTDGSTTFIDSSTYARAITAGGNAQIDTAQYMFGGASGLFDGSGDYLRCAQSSDFQLFGGAFTAEGWYRPVSNTGNQCLIEFGSNNNNRVNISVVSGNILVYRQAPGGSVLISGSAPTAGAWVAWCLEGNGTTIALRINGTTIGTSPQSTLPTGNLFLDIGRSNHGSAGDFSGHMDEVRITKGIQRYGGDYTPSGPFPNK